MSATLACYEGACKTQEAFYTQGSGSGLKAEKEEAVGMDIEGKPGFEASGDIYGMIRGCATETD